MIKSSKYTEYLQQPFDSYFEEGDVLNGTQIYRWAGTDSKVHFERIKTNRKYSAFLSSYIENPIIYRVDKNNFRTDIDSYDGEIDIALGDSNTFGVGMYEDYIWPNILSKLTGVPILNLGICSAGVEHSYIALTRILSKYKVRKVFHLAEIFGRLCYVDGKKFFTKGIKDRGTILYEHRKYIDAIAGVCSYNNIDYYYFHSLPYTIYFTASGFDDMSKTRVYKSNITIPENDLVSRDLIHPSKLQQKELADRFETLLDEKLFIESVEDVLV